MSHHDEKRSKHPAARLVARVDCALPDGTSRRLYASRVTRGGAFILAMRPPALGTVLTLHLELAGHEPIEEQIEALVIGQRVDPGDAERTGFEVVFTRISKEARRLLGSVLDTMPSPALELVPAPRHTPEQRREPRVATMLRGVLVLQPEPLTVEIVNLSLSGALLGLGAKACPLEPGDVAELSIVAPAIPETVNLQVRIVRCSSDPPGLGVHFLTLDPQMERRIEGLLIDALGQAMGAKTPH